MAEAARMPMCPMAETCKGMMARPFSIFTLIMPGLVFILLGVLIIIWPAILVWFVAIAFVLVGVMMLMMAGFVRRVGSRLHTAQ